MLESEDEWKALYMAAWGCANFYLKERFYNTELWEKKLAFGLPASRQKYRTYTPAKLYEILTSKDIEFTLGHLQTLFSLLEELVTNLCPLVCYGQECSAGIFENLEKFLLGNKPYDKFQINITEDDIKELKLAKETRNCFIHNGSKVDEKWLKAFKEARRVNSAAKIGDKLPINFHQVEDWHELIIQTVNKIKNGIIKL